MNLDTPSLQKEKFGKCDDVENCNKSADVQKFLPNEGFSHLTSLSGNVSSTCVERDAECLDTHTLIKDLQTQNSKLAKEKEGLLNKLSVQNKVEKLCTTIGFKKAYLDYAIHPLA